MEQIFRVVLSLSVSGSLIGLLLLLFRPVTGRFLQGGGRIIFGFW